MYKKIIYIIILTVFSTSCADTFDSVKRGLTGAKKKSGDEFLIQKKDPLILPPDFENLPSPDERSVAEQEISIFEKSLQNLEEETPSKSSSTEESILKKIRSK